MQYGIENFTIHPGLHCFFSCLYNIAAYYGITLRESEIFFLCNGLNCFYRNDQQNLYKRLYFDSYEELTHVFSREIAVDMNVGYDLKHRYYFDAMGKALQKNYPVMLMVDPKILSYHPLEERVENSCHCIIAYGMDIGSNQFHIGDSYVVDAKGNVTTYTGPFPLDVLRDGTYGFAWFDAGRYHPYPQSKMIGRVAENLERFLENHDQAGQTNGSAALYEFMEGIREYQENTPVFEQEYLDIIYMLKVRFSFIIDYLTDILQRHPVGNPGILEQLQKLKDEWNVFIIKILMASQSPTQAMFERLTRGGISLVRKQEELFREIHSGLKQGSI